MIVVLFTKPYTRIIFNDSDFQQGRSVHISFLVTFKKFCSHQEFDVSPIGLICMSRKAFDI